MFPNTQMEYEKSLYAVKVADDKRKLYKLRQKIIWDVQHYEDYRFWTFKRTSATEIVDLRHSMDKGELDV